MVPANHKALKNTLKVLIVCAAQVPTLLLAAPNTDFMTNQSTLTQSQDQGFLSRVNLETSLEHSQRTAQDEKSKREESMDLSLGVGYKINQTFKASIKTYFSKPNTGSQETEISNTQLGLGMRGYELNSSVRTTHSVAAIIPTSVQSREQDRLKGGLILSNGLRYQGSVLMLQYSLGLTENFHEFNLNAQGSPNVQRTLVNSLTTQVQLAKRFSVSAVGVYGAGRTYGNKERSSFQFHGDLNYDVDSKMTLNLGTSNAGQALKANGVDSNITAFDEDSAVIRAGISIVL